MVLDCGWEKDSQIYYFISHDIGQEVRRVIYIYIYKYNVGDISLVTHNMKERY